MYQRPFSAFHGLSNGISSPSTAPLGRLDRVKELLENNQFDEAALKCNSLYKNEKASILEDLHELDDTGVYALIFDKYKNHILVRTMIHNDAIMLLLRPETGTESLQRAANELFAVGAVSKAVCAHLGIEPALPQELVDFFVIQQAAAGDPMLAASSAIRLKSGGIIVSETVLVPIIRALLADKGVNQNYHAYTLLRLTDEFLIESLPQNLLIDILAYMLYDKTPFFANIWFKRIQNVHFEDEKGLLDVFARLLEANSASGIVSRAISVYEASCGRESLFPQHYPGAFSRFIQLLVKSESPKDALYVEDLIKKAPEEIIAHPELIDFSLKYYGANDRARFEALVKQLVPPLLRLALSALFQGFLSQTNQFAADKVLQLIFSSKTGINSGDFDAIIRRLLDQNNLEECITMIGRAELEVSKSGQVSILLHILHQKSQKKYPQFTKEIANNFRRLQPNDETLYLLTGVFFRYFSGTVSNRASRQLYTRLAQNATLGVAVFDLEKYGILQGFFRLLRLDVSNKMGVLKIIGKQALLEKDVHVLKWVVTMMKTIGASQSEALKELERLGEGLGEFLKERTEVLQEEKEELEDHDGEDLKDVGKEKGEI